MHETRTKVYSKGELFDRVNATALHADKLVGEASHAAKTAAEVSEQQKKFLPEEEQAILTATKNVQGLIGDLKTNLSGTKDTVSKLNQLLDDLHKEAGDLDGLTLALKKDIEDVDPVLSATKQAIQDLDANLINDPDIKIALKQLASAMTNVNGVTENFNKMSEDAANKFHHILTDKPSVKTRIVSYLQIAYYLALIKATLGIKSF